MYTKTMFQTYHHVQIAIPPLGEPAARRFYCDMLGFAEIPKPAALAGRGGLWLRSGAVELHLGVEQDFAPARKAHPALQVADLTDFLATLPHNDQGPERHFDIPGLERVFLFDPFGNRIEIVAPRA